MSFIFIIDFSFTNKNVQKTFFNKHVQNIVILMFE
jgi:hypothetical protein